MDRIKLRPESDLPAFVRARAHGWRYAEDREPAFADLPVNVECGDRPGTGELACWRESGHTGYHAGDGAEWSSAGVDR